MPTRRTPPPLTSNHGIGIAEPTGLNVIDNCLVLDGISYRAPKLAPGTTKIKLAPGTTKTKLANNAKTTHS